MCVNCGKEVKHWLDVFCSLRCYDAAHEEDLENICKKGGDRKV
jgi:endogenous inhibitor of DNA gyrase (YacG/DUF329 family)